MQHLLVGLASEEGQHVSSMHLQMGGAHRTYACIRTSEVKILFTTK